MKKPCDHENSRDSGGTACLSAGLMVNYSYELGAVDANHSRHVATGDVIASEEVVGLCGAAPASKL